MKAEIKMHETIAMVLLILWLKQSIYEAYSGWLSTLVMWSCYMMKSEEKKMNFMKQNNRRY